MLRDKKFDALMIFIAVMALAMCVLIVAVKIKQSKASEQQIIPENTIVEEQPTGDTDGTVTDTTTDTTNSDTSTAADTATGDTAGDTATEKVMAKTTDLVNVRAEADANATKLATVDAGTEFEVIEQLDTGWTRIVYEGGEAYVKSEYLQIIN